MMLTLTWQTTPLELHDPFTLSYGTTSVRNNVILTLSDGEITGLGEAAVVPYYGETPENIGAYLSQPAVQALLTEDPADLEHILTRLPQEGSKMARAGLDMAFHDLWAKRLGYPLYQLWGLNPQRVTVSSITVAMSADEADYQRRLEAVKDYPLVKLKLGSGDLAADLARVEFARSLLTGQLCVDANGGWSTKDTLEAIPPLTQWGIVLIEQPVAKEDWQGWRDLQTYAPAQRPPLIADESVQGLESLGRLMGLVDGINIKLAKCGGLYPARQMMTLARWAGLKVMLGCMVESSVAISAAAQLAPLADFLDLDGNLLINNDPFQGVKAENGRLKYSAQAGLGVVGA